LASRSRLDNQTAAQAAEVASELSDVPVDRKYAEVDEVKTHYLSAIGLSARLI
jgi:hypothetical protein